MKRKSPFTGPARTLVGALALMAAAAFAAPSAALAANTTADAKILNVVTVDYKDAGGLASFQATASATVTINLVPSALVATNPPTSADPGGTAGLTCAAAGPYASGSTRESLYALTATTNGDDNYALSMANVPTNANNVTVAYRVLTATGAVESLNPANRDFGSAVPVGVKDDATLYFPGGSLAGFADGDIVLVEYAASKVAYLIDGAPVVGNAASHDNLGGAEHSDVGVTTAEVQGELKLKAFPITAITINGVAFNVGSNTAPAFNTTAPVVGSVVGEMVLVKVSVTATANVYGANGSVAYTLTATDGSNAETIGCPVSFEGVALTIKKEVRNFTDSGAFGAAGNGDPGEILEYRLTITNTGGDATQVTVEDAVPDYTTLVSAAYGAGIFAQASLNGGAAVNITAAADDDESGTVASGNAPSATAGQPITFYVGNGNQDSTNAGGTLIKNDDVVITYQVTID